MVSQQTVLVDGIRPHIRNLCPALETDHSVTNESDESSGDELLIDCASAPPPMYPLARQTIQVRKVWCTSRFKRVCGSKEHPCPALCVIKRSGGSVVAIMLTHDKKGQESCHASERDLELDQKQMTYERGREHLFFSTHSFNKFWHYIAKCLDG